MRHALSPLSPNVTVPHAWKGVLVPFFTSLILLLEGCIAIQRPSIKDIMQHCALAHSDNLEAYQACLDARMALYLPPKKAQTPVLSQAPVESTPSPSPSSFSERPSALFSAVFDVVLGGHPEAILSALLDYAQSVSSPDTTVTHVIPLREGWERVDTIEIQTPDDGERRIYPSVVLRNGAVEIVGTIHPQKGTVSFQLPILACFSQGGFERYILFSERGITISDQPESGGKTLATQLSFSALRTPTFRVLEDGILEFQLADRVTQSYSDKVTFGIDPHTGRIVRSTLLSPVYMFNPALCTMRSEEGDSLPLIDYVPDAEEGKGVKVFRLDGTPSGEARLDRYYSGLLRQR
ncbi:hypothetical protein COY07_03155 [Candidatus Peregrinibacteria bacterium CG_4_10_14_0_2_um_filter_43_11]|nr:MAG: hypothetical protein COY07_03155 [Candidatus Peregrinibacteria bacterium CG_4_10_14_0_2_um_filter_43_11]